MKKKMDFIIIPRSIFDADAFENEMYSKREAFLDLVQMAAYERTEVFLSGHKYIAERGQVIVSKSFLAKRWHWGVDKVRRFIQYLERTNRCKHMCDHQCNQPITSISIVSYDSYQGVATNNATTDDTICATTPAIQEKEIINKKEEIKKTSNEVKENPRRFVRPTVEEIRAYCQEHGYSIDAEHFFNYYESKGWVVGKSPMKDWRAAVRTWVKNSSQSLFSTQEQEPEQEPIVYYQSLEELEAARRAKRKQ